ncbi:arginine--tRNA ligase [Candidatus Parcubacteria bacterium]|nr:arginine--tRNA ligase [Candidatus Parcubacteria bacterium]
MIREDIKNIVEKACFKAKFSIDRIDFSIEHPEQEKYGDYSTNIAMQISKTLKKDPMEIAKIINNHLLIIDPEFLEKVEIVKPGFVNFFISKEYLQKQVKEILKKREKFGDLNIGKNKKIQIEFISANPTGPLTIGNARGGPFGDVLANVLKKSGFKIEKAYYINDFGKQILALGHSVLKDKEAVYKGEYIDKLHKQIKEKDPYKAGQKSAKIIIDEMIKKTVRKMGIKYDEWFFESRLYKSGKVDEIIEFLKKKKLVYKKDGALWFKSSKYGDNRDRVLVKQDGSKTYLAGDIAYHRYKFEKKKFTKVINVWGTDHYGDIPGLKAGIEALGHKDKLEIILHQFVTILRKGEKQRMSKRKGVYFTIDELLDEVGSDVMRFFFLQKSINTHLNFDIALAREQSEKNPVYYIQYAYARIHSILAKSKYETPAFAKASAGKQNLKVLNHPTELKLIKQLIRFPEIIEDTTKDYQVQRIPQYAFDLANVFHQFYRDCKVITEDKALFQSRLALIEAVKIVLKNALDLMGISAPKKM